MSERNTKKQAALENLRYLMPGEATANNPYNWVLLARLPVRTIDALADVLQCAHDRGLNGVELNPEAPMNRRYSNRTRKGK